ncbi:MAG: hypothetical protein Q7T74_00085 [Candidatus Saccharibacteria bacterium]|nr:hypothetical protein [Candidatus Saccharibacteria bacterium]
MGAENENVDVLSPSVAASDLASSGEAAATVTEVKVAETEVKLDAKPDKLIVDTKNLVDFAELDEISGELPTQKKDAEKQLESKKTAQQPEDKKVTQTASRKQVLDQLGVKVELQPTLQQMSNEAFDFVVERIKELTETKTKYTEANTQLTEARKGQVTLPQSYYENPDAFRLHPKFAEASGNYNTVVAEADHWRKQLIAIEQGKEWIDLEVDAQGKIIAKKMEPSVEAKYTVAQYHENAKTLQAQYAQQMQGVYSEFKNGHESLKQFIKQREEIFFPHLKDEKVAQANKYYAGMHSLLKAKGLDQNPLTSLTAKMYSYLMEQIEINNKLNKQLKSNGSVVKKETQPTAEELDNKGKKIDKGSNIVDFAEFDRLAGQPSI